MSGRLVSDLYRFGEPQGSPVSSQEVLEWFPERTILFHLVHGVHRRYLDAIRKYFKSTLELYFYCLGIVPQTVLALGVLTVLLRALERCLDPVALPASVFPCELQYLVTPTLKNTQ